MNLKRKWVLFPEYSNYGLDYNEDDFLKNIRKEFELYLVNEIENKTQIILDIKDNSDGAREIYHLEKEIDNMNKWLNILRNDE